MNDNNPYSPPQSDVTPPPLLNVNGELLVTPRSVPMSAAFQWLTQSWALVKTNLGLWVLLTLALFALQIVMVFVPVLGDIATLLLNPVFTGGLLLGLRAVERGEALRFDYLFEGFKQKFAPLLGVGALTLGVMFLFMIIISGLFVGLNFDVIKEDGFDPAKMLNGLSGGLLVVSVIIEVLVMMLFWFTTQLVTLNDVPVFESLNRSFQGCLRNPLSLLVYVLMIMVIMLMLLLPPGLLFFAFFASGESKMLGNIVLLVVAALVLFAELLLLAPWLFGTMYVSYKAIFLK